MVLPANTERINIEIESLDTQYLNWKIEKKFRSYPTPLLVGKCTFLVRVGCYFYSYNNSGINSL